jgi:hypothetical protein
MMQTKFARYAWVALVISLFAVLSGCTKLPVKEFSAYKGSFNKARSAGEEVLLDYGAALAQREEMKRREAVAGSSEPQSAREQAQVFNPAAIGIAGQDVDVVGVRMKAWEVVARYNDTLTALAEGKSADALKASVEGLTASLQNFPIAKVAGAVGNISPWIGSLTTLLAAAEAERSRQEFIDVVDKGAPLILGTSRVKAGSGDPVDIGFLGLLQADAENFFNVRLALNIIAYTRITDSADTLGGQYQALATDYGHPEDLKKLTATVNEQFKALDPNLEPVKLSSTGTKTYSTNIHSQLVQISVQVADKALAAQQLTAELADYKKVLTSYMELLLGVRESLQGLQVAVQNTQQSLPPTEDLIKVYIDLKQSLEAYRTSRRT